jgi:glycosyltransferase involved in cell wall biosynthesis
MPIRLLLVARPAAGGMATHLRALCTQLNTDDYHVTVAAPKSTWIPAGVAHVPLEISDKITPHRDALNSWRLQKLMRSGQYDLVHTHGLKAALLTALARQTSKSLPSVVTLHNALPEHGSRWRDSFLHWALTSVDALVVVSQAQERDICLRKLVEPARIATIPNGIALPPSKCLSQTERDATRASLGVSPDDCLVVTVARLLAAKGIGDLIQAAYLLHEQPRLRFAVVGDGPDRSHFTTLAASLGVTSSVSLLGYRHDVAQLLQVADLFVLPSHSEGTPLSILEAMAARCAVVATDVGGIPEIVEDGQTGYLIPARHAEAIAGAVAHLAADPARRRALGEAGRQRVEAHFTQERMLTKLSSLYQSLLSSPQTRLPSRNSST